MYPNIIGQHLYRFTNRMDPRTGTYSIRQASTEPGVADTFTSYILSALTYRPPTQDELILIQASVSDRVIVWVITAVELNMAIPPAPPIPTPAKGYELTVNNSMGVAETWVMDKVTYIDLMQAYECLCRYSPTNMGLTNKNTGDGLASGGPLAGGPSGS